MKSESLSFSGSPVGKIITVTDSKFRFEPIAENDLAFFGIEDHLFDDKEELKAAVYSRLRQVAA